MTDLKDTAASYYRPTFSNEYGDTRQPVPTARQGSIPERAPDAPDLLALEPAPSGGGWRSLLASVNPRTIDGPQLPLVVLGLSALLGGWSSQALGIAAPEIQATFGVSVVAIVALSSVTSVIITLLGIPLGYLADIVKRVWLVRIGAIMGPVGDFAQALAPTSGSSRRAASCSRSLACRRRPPTCP